MISSLFSVSLVKTRNEKSSEVYSTEVITKILKEEGSKLFDSRAASLGHTLQGGTPSPLDRARATRLAVKCCEFLEREGLKARESLSKNAGSSKPYWNKDTAVIITIRGSSIVFTSAEEMSKEADFKNRRGKQAWWHEHKTLVELMGGRLGLSE